MILFSGRCSPNQGTVQGTRTRQRNDWSSIDRETNTKGRNSSLQGKNLTSLKNYFYEFSNKPCDMYLSLAF